MRRSPADSTNRSLAAFGKLQHILLARELYQRVMTDFRMRQHGHRGRLNTCLDI